MNAPPAPPLRPATLEWAAARGIAAEPAPPAYLEEPRGIARGHGLLVRPRSTAEVSEIVRACAADRVAIIPYGGGTGLVGGQISGEGPIPLILSLERMRAIRDVDPAAGVLVAEAGATLAEVQEAARRAGRLFPLSLASEGSCRIGGNLATNAGGVQVLRYGNARDLCLGLEAVLADGSVHHGLSALRKDNTGYDLRHLLIGSEGTLGIITAAALRLFPLPAERATALAVTPGPGAALSILNRLQEATGGQVSAFELIAGQGLAFLAETLPQVRRPFDPPPGWMVLAEVATGPGEGAEARLTDVLADAADTGEVSDALLAQSESQRQEFWTVRETIPEANRLIGAISSHDISLPLGHIEAFIGDARERIEALAPGLRINCFGHLGDGNLHFNVFPPRGKNRENWRPRAAEIAELVYELVHAFGGSISAEHGIGRFKRDALARYGDPAKLAAMRAIKKALDPEGILNPGAVL